MFGGTEFRRLVVINSAEVEDFSVLKKLDRSDIKTNKSVTL